MHSPALVPQIHTHTHNYNTIHSTVTLYTLAALTHPTLLATHACPINNRQPLISNTRTPHQHHIHTTLPVCLISTTHTHHQHYTHEAPHTHTTLLTIPLHQYIYIPTTTHAFPCTNTHTNLYHRYTYTITTPSIAQLHCTL